MLKFSYWAIYLSFATVTAYVHNYVNYCNPKICGNTNSHTFCKYYVGPAVSCVGYVEAPLSREEKQRILHRFNERRNYVAGGNLRFFPPASNMLKMRWVEELARSAQRWADQCQSPASPEETDTCRDLFSVAVAQSVASLVGEAPGLRAESLVDMWYMQSLSYNGSATRYETNENQKPSIDFAQMVWSDSHLVGCGRSKFMVPINHQLRTVERLVCNIAPAGIEPGSPFWLPGTPASRCPLRSERDEQYTNLCSYRTMDDNVYLNYMSCNNDSNETICNPKRDTILIKAILFWESLNEVENNPLLNYQGSLDDIYFKKVSSITMDDDSFTKLNSKINKTNKYLVDENVSGNGNTVALEITRLLMSNGNVKHKLIGRTKSRPEELTEQEIDTMTLRSRGPVKYKSSTQIRQDILNPYDPRGQINQHSMDPEYVVGVGPGEDVKEASNGMENSLAATQATMPYNTKVRRELKNTNSITEYVTQDDAYPRKSLDTRQLQLQNSIAATKHPLLEANEGFFNNSAQAPVMKIVMKYMPMLKQYNSLLGSAANKINISTYLITLMNCLILINCTDIKFNNILYIDFDLYIILDDPCENFAQLVQVISNRHISLINYF